MKRISSYLLIISVFISICSITKGQTNNIKNDTFWKTKDGLPINSQGGGIFKFADPITGVKKYYWYGVNYEEANLYRINPSITQPKATFESVTCYSSTDLVKWTFEKDVLTKAETNRTSKTWVGRLGVAYIKAIKKYAMFVQHGGKVLITSSDSPIGEFKWHQEISMEKMIGTSNTGDQTVFTDDDTGKSYLVYSYGKGRNKIYVSEIGIKDNKINLIDCIQIFKGESREGNCMFKHKGKFYMFASNIYGWDSSLAYYLVADNIRGPYLPTNKMLVMKGSDQDYAHVTQTGFFVTVKGTEQETVIYCGDRWANFAGNGLGYNQWFPISFENNTPYFNSLNSWNLNAKTGKWTVANDNDFIKNGSFEADRKRIPSVIKPIQTQLTGWETIIIKGNKISLDSTKSPNLNYFNTQSDRLQVIGEKSLFICDNIDFKRKVFQTISSSPSVKLTDGLYTLKAKIKNNKGFKQLEIYALSKEKTFKYAVTEENTNWKNISITAIAIKDGKVEIGFLADGKANAAFFVDDVSLVKNL